MAWTRCRQLVVRTGNERVGAAAMGFVRARGEVVLALPSACFARRRAAPRSVRARAYSSRA